MTCITCDQLHARYTRLHALPSRALLGTPVALPGMPTPVALPALLGMPTPVALGTPALTALLGMPTPGLHLDLTPLTVFLRI